MTPIEAITQLSSGSLSFVTEDRAIRITGADARTWLQGQITNDIKLLTPDCPVSACLCNPKGQIETTCRFYAHNNIIIAISPRPQIILDRIEQFVIMEDVSAELIPGSITTQQGPTAKGEFPNDRSGYGGFDSISSEPADSIPGDLLDMIEIAAGIPRFGNEIAEKTLPPELGPQFDRTFIHYEKGCYTGQEVLQRIHSRGHTNKTLVGLTSQAIPSASPIEQSGKITGTIHRSAQHPILGWISTATIRNEHAQPGSIINHEGQPLKVVELPFLD